MGPQHFFPGHFFPDRRAYIPSPLGEKKVRHHENSFGAAFPKSKIRILGGIYGEKPAPQADFFFFWGGDFFFPPHPKT